MKRINSSACVLFRRENSDIKYLLLHYRYGHWGFPKGIIEKGENEKDTLKREIKEETGISKIKFIDGFNQKISYFLRVDGFLTFKRAYFFLVETDEKDVKLSFEHIGYEWLSYKDAYTRLSYRNTRRVLRKANNFLKK
jgi:bis(5'-nucleosidyl)-tetraphosphatase